MVYYTIAEASEILQVSKVTIYNKLKTLKKELKPHIKLKQGVKYIDTTGFEIIKESLGFKAVDLNDFKQVEIALTSELKQGQENVDISKKTDDGFNLNSEFKLLKTMYEEMKEEKENHIATLKKEIDYLRKENESKSQQITNFQVMIAKENEQRLMLEERINQLKQEKENPGFWKRIFGK